MTAKHCFVWGWTASGDLKQYCPHCGYASHEWPSISDHDADRVRESQNNHNDKCPGTPWCAKRRSYA